MHFMVVQQMMLLLLEGRGVHPIRLALFPTQLDSHVVLCINWNRTHTLIYIILMMGGGVGRMFVCFWGVFGRAPDTGTDTAIPLRALSIGWSTSGACIICFGDYTYGEELCRLPCNHLYHARVRFFRKILELLSL